MRSEAGARVDGDEHLSKDAAGLRLLQSPMRNDKLEELTAGDILRDEIDVPWLLNHLEQVDHMRVVNMLEDLDLARHALHITLICDALFLENLDSNSLTGEEMHTKLDLAKCALANRLR